MARSVSMQSSPPTAGVTKAVILAAGRGTRMGVQTESLPKPMLPVRGKPLIQHIVENLSTAGIKRILIVVGYHGQALVQHFEKGPWDVTFAWQDPVNGTGSAALLGADFAGDDSFLLTFGDILCESDEYTRCKQVMAEYPETAAVIGVKQVDDPWQGAAVYEQQGRIERIIEKPPRGTSTTRWNSAGLFVLSRAIFPYLKKLPLSIRNEYEITTAFDMMLQDHLELRIAPVLGGWRDVGRPEDLEFVNRES
jgi:UDP-N-acetylglucosamine diphosphorylase / glucose-1-phosphate thymidylyltransferase / UDP-N-acetylgalactosamine diphosphorylase / glucosamine-1-phosphate N-acetyltransferase / galactosamine-1-phosphate N-acetyltransferase